MISSRTNACLRYYQLSGPAMALLIAPGKYNRGMALEKSNAYGAGLALRAALGFSLKAIFVKLAYPYGVDAITLLALRMGFALPAFLLVGLRHGRRGEP